MTKGVCCVLLLLLPTSAWAQAAPIRSGEHPSFSRLVISVPPGSEWSLGKSGSASYELSVEGVTNFDTSAVFGRLPRGRMAGLRNLDGTLSVDLACDCHATAYRWQNDKVVLDIVDGPAPDNSPFETEPSSTPEQSVIRLPIAPDLRIETPAPSAVASAQLMETLAVAAVQKEQIDELQMAVIESLSRAASQGLLKAQENQLLAQRPMQAPESPIRDPLDLIPAGPDEIPGRPGILARTSIEREGFQAQMDPLSPVGDLCLPADVFEFEKSQDHLGFSDEIAALRSAVTSEFDLTTEQAVTSLAKGYLSFGFGREAIQSLQIDGLLTQERTIIAEMARIVDDEQIFAGQLIDQVGCDGPSALWGFLSRPENGYPSSPNRGAILRGLALLPASLQTTFAPRLSRAFLAIGDTEAAALALNVSTADTAPSALAETAAAVSMQVGEAERAEQTLSQLAAVDTRISPDALVQLIKLKIEGRQPILEAEFELAAALRFESSGTDISKKLALAEIEGRLYGQQFEAAQDLIIDIGAELTDEERAALEDKIAKSIVAYGTDLEFLIFSEDIANFDISQESRVSIANRQNELGFPEMALATLASADSATESVRLAQASAYLKIGDAERLDRTLGEDLSDEANRLRRAVGLSVPNSPQDASIIAPQTSSEAPSRISSDPSLAEGRALLDSAIETRASVATLLSQAPELLTLGQ